MIHIPSKWELSPLNTGKEEKVAKVERETTEFGATLQSLFETPEGTISQSPKETVALDEVQRPLLRSNSVSKVTLRGKPALAFNLIEKDIPQRVVAFADLPESEQTSLLQECQREVLSCPGFTQNVKDSYMMRMRHAVSSRHAGSFEAMIWEIAFL